jgi:hypothetical protein
MLSPRARLHSTSLLGGASRGQPASFGVMGGMMS